MARRILYTVGHSTRTLEDFVALLAQHGVGAIADVRRFPGSRKYPHFGVDALAASLPAAGVRYVPMPALGGRRRTHAGSPNGGWRNEGFRGYADHMDSDEFAAGVDELVTLARAVPTAIMCASAPASSGPTGGPPPVSAACSSSASSARLFIASIASGTFVTSARAIGACVSATCLRVTGACAATEAMTSALRT